MKILPKIKNWKIYTSLFGSLSVILLSMLYIMNKGIGIAETHTPLIAVVKDAQNEAAISHLRLEKWIDGEKHIEFDIDVTGKLAGAIELFESLKKDKIKLYDPDYFSNNVYEEKRIDSIRKILIKLKHLSEERKRACEEGDTAGMNTNRLIYYLEFRKFNNVSKELTGSIQEAIDSDTRKFSALSNFLMLFSLFTAIVLGFVFNRFLIKRDTAAKELFDKSERLAVTLDSIGDGVIATDSHGVITGLNPAAAELIGLRIDEAVGRHIEDVFIIVNQFTGEKAANPVLKALKEGIMVGLANHTTLLSHNGKQYHITDCASPLRQLDGSIIGAVIVFQNITEKYTAEEALRFERNQLLTIFDSIDELIYISDPETFEVLYCNNAFKQKFGEVTGKICYSSIQGLGKQCEFCTNKYIFVNTGESYIWEFQNTINKRWYRCIDKAIRWSDGRLVRYEMAIDITARKIAEESIALSEERYRRLFETMAQGVVYQSSDGSIINANPAAERILGLTLNQMLGRDSFDSRWKMTKPDGSLFQGHEHPAMVSLRTGEPVSNQLMGVFNPVELEHKWILVSSTPLFRNNESKPYQVYATFTDITERKMLEDALEKRILALTQPLGDTSAIKFSDLFDIKEIQAIQDSFASATGVASIITDTDGNPITEPSNFCRLCKEIIRKTEKGLNNCKYSDSIIGRHNPDGSNISPCLSGGLWDAGTSISVGGHHIANWLIGQVRDDTQSEDRMLEYCREIGADEKEFTEAMKEVTKMPQEQFKRVANALFILAKQLSNLALQNVQQAREITTRRQVEAELMEIQRKITTLFANLPGMAFRCSYDRDWTMEFVSDGCFQITGYQAVDLIGNRNISYNSIIFEEDRNYVYNEIENAIKQKEIYKIAYKITEKNGKQRWVWEQGSGIYSSDGQVIAIEGFITDITERISAEKHLAESEKKFRAIFEFANDGIILLKDDRIVECNPKTEEIFAAEKENIVNQSVFDFSAEYQPDGLDSRSSGFDKINAAIAGNLQFFEWKHKRADGEEIDTEVHLNRISYSAEILLLAIIRDVTERKRAEDELFRSEKRFHSLYNSMNEGVVLHDLLYDAHGNPANYRITDVNLSFEKVLQINREDIVGKLATDAYGVQEPPYLEKYAETVRTGVNFEFDTFFEPMDKYFHISAVNYEKDKFATIFFDITDRKKTEQLIKSQMEELEAKNAEMELFTYTVSHDLRSPLITIKGFLGMLAEDIKSGDMDLLEKDMARISNAADKMQMLLEDLLELSRIGRTINPPKRVSMEQLAGEVEELLHAGLTEKNVKLVIQPELPIVFGDMQRLREALQNLVENAIKFIGDNPEPTIEIGYIVIDGEGQFFVRDNGIGIANKYLEKIFGLFDKLDPSTEGTGVGLALVKRIIEVHGGRIRAYSEGLGKGSTFYFTMPTEVL